MIKIYLASAIDQNRYGSGRSTKDRVKRNCLDEIPDVWIYDPAEAFDVSGNPRGESSIWKVNHMAITESNVMIAILPKGVPSIGVPMEIEYASSAGIPTLIVSDVESWAWPTRRPNVRVIPEWNISEVDWILENKSRGFHSMPFTVTEDGEAPRRGYEDDAGLDLVVSEETIVPPGEFRDVPSGVNVQLPEWSWGMITGRSSTIRNRGLLVPLGVIDAGYRGPLFASCWNLTDEPVVVAKGDRIAQLIVIPNATRNVELVEVEALGLSERGSNGFGSSGT